MPAIPDPTYLRQVALFGGLELPDLAVLNGLMRRQVFPGGVRILTAGQLDDTAYVVRQGTVKVEVQQADGTEVIVAIVGPGELIDQASVGDRFGEGCSIVALEETTLFWIDREQLDRCLARMPLLAANRAALLARRLRLANERIEALAAKDVRGRVVRHLLLLGRAYGEPLDADAGAGVRIPLRLTQGDLASLAAASRSNVNQVLGDLRRRELVSTDQTHHLLLHDVDALADLR
jgi:CRP/FNR family transcriptional regulator, cyclic AMP receptor protein